jgi:hypothetical protein
MVSLIPALRYEEREKREIKQKRTDERGMLT